MGQSDARTTGAHSPAASTPATREPIEREAAERVAHGARVLLDPTRLQLLGLILDSEGGRALVGGLAASLGLSQPTVSHHARVLIDEGILRGERDGRRVWYSVVPARLGEVREALLEGEPRAAGPVGSTVLDRIAADLATRFAGVFGPETIARYVHESHELLAREARVTRYLPSLTARFAADRLRALASADELITDHVPEVLFVCVQNAGRSQLAAAILRALAGDRVRVRTAGSAPADAVNAAVVRALDEIGVPLAGEYPKPLTDEVVRAADYVVTMGCGDACPVYPGRRYVDWELADPVGLTMEGVRAVRDDIEARVRRLLADMDLGPLTGVNSA